MKVLLQGVDGRDALFDVDGKGVLVNTRTLAASVVPLEATALERFWVAPENDCPLGAWSEIARCAANRFKDEVAITASGLETRAYTVPKGVQTEARRGLDWYQIYQTGGTQVALKVAATLAAGGQVQLADVRHVARYFARHERVSGDPSGARISWALWGGDPASRWVRSTLGRLENLGVTADGDVTVNLISFYEGEDDDRAFFAERRDDVVVSLYRKTPQNTWLAWYAGDWDDCEPPAGELIELDDETAMYVASSLYDAPEIPVDLRALDPEEWEIHEQGLSGIDWDAVERAMSASALRAAGKEYTPQERSANAAEQPRDAMGRFARIGDTGVMKSGTRAKIVTVNPVDNSLIVQADDGNTYAIPARDFTIDSAVGVPNPKTPLPVKPGTPVPYIPPLNLDAILGQPRATSTSPKAWLRSLLPPMGPAALKQVVANYQNFIRSERDANARRFEGGTAFEESRKDPPNKVLEWSRRQRARNAAEDARRETERRRAEEVRRRKAGIKRLEEQRPKSIQNQTPGRLSGTRASGEPTATTTEKLTPETADVQPLYLAIVDRDDPRAVTDLVAMIPASSANDEPTTYRRVAGDWVEDVKVLEDMRSPTPPPIVQLNDEDYQDVLKQVDTAPSDTGEEPIAPSDVPPPAVPAPTASTPAPVAASTSPLVVTRQAEVIPLWGPNEQLLHLIVAAGGIDRNQGNAERLRTYWLHGKGAAKIRWGTGGDWRRCFRHLSKYMGARAKGYCALRHKEATGMWTGDRAHRQLYGHVPDVRAFDSSYDLLSSREVIRASADVARAEVARSRVFGVGSDDPAIPDTVEQVPTEGGRRFRIPLLIPEGLESGDNRTFDVGAIGQRVLPLPLLWQIKTGDGHDGSVIVGRIDTLERVPGGLGNATGVFDVGPYGREAQRLVENRMLRWISADLDRFEAKEIKPELANDEPDDEGNIRSPEIRVKKSRFMAATLVAKPAFQECTIELEPIGEVVRVEDGMYVDNRVDQDAGGLVAAGVTASRIPVHPPAPWFEDPQLDHATPITVTNDGRVFGHIAGWDIDHIGMQFGTRPPHSYSNYAYFHTGVLATAEGNEVAVGQLTLAGGHASLEADAALAVKHYDDTASAIADVHAGEDRHGIWVAGSLRPGTTPEQIRVLRASAPSGDWRPINGRLELVAVCQVNVPGFPVARARVASGAVVALVAAGAGALARMKGDPVAEMQERLAHLEDFEAQRARIRAEAAIARVEDARREHAEKAKELETIAASARERVYRFLDVDGYLSEFKDFSPDRRKKLASDKKALPDGSFPIENVADLRRAIHAYGRAKEENKAKVRRHIIRRARGLGKPDLIPKDWKENSLNDLALNAHDAREVLTAAAQDRMNARVATARARIGKQMVELATLAVEE